MAGILNPSATLGNAVNIAPALSLLLSDSPTTDKTTTKITLDPVTRIEGHLRIDTQVTEGVITDAWSSATLFRGIELILAGRDPRDAPLITQRLCGVCTYVHLQASSVDIENAMQLTVPANAQIVRNLINGVQFLHDHIVHFYHLHALDWVDVTAAVKADPNATQTLARQISPSTPAMDFAAVKAKLQSLVDSGQLGPFAAGYPQGSKEGFSTPCVPLLQALPGAPGSCEFTTLLLWLNTGITWE